METKAKIVVLGMFDGMHTGHASLFFAACSIKKECNLDILAYTFRNHPAELIRGKKPKLILTNKEREQMLYAAGASEVVMDEFTHELSAMSADDFAQMLKTRFCAHTVVAGFNYTFAKEGKGTPEILVGLGKKYGFSVHISDPVLYLGEPVSSTRIRRAVEQGDVCSANAMLGYPYRMSGVVERCKQIGRTIGFPTANIRNCDGKPLPLFGVYLTRVKLGERTFFGVTNVGTNPTFGENDISVETHIFDFCEDIYGEYIQVKFLQFIREQKRFSSVDELKMQIDSDCKTALSLTVDAAKSNH